MTREEAIMILKDCELNPCVPKDKEAANMAIKALEQEPILDKIRAEIAREKQKINFKRLDAYEKAQAEMRLSTLNELLQIIDKYKAESEDAK